MTRQKRQRRQFTDEEIAFVKKHYRQHGPAWCAKALGRWSGSVSALTLRLKLRKECVRPVPQQHSSLYSTAQLDALDLIGGAYTDKRIDFDTAVMLRDLVRENQIDEALGMLEVGPRRAA